MTKRVSLEKAASVHSGRAKCTDCPIYKKTNNLCWGMDMAEICNYAFRKGFKSGYKYHSKLNKKK